MKKDQLISEFLIMAQKMPLYKINVGELCKKADVSRSTFYRFYDSIYDLAEELEGDHIDGFLNISREHENSRSSLEAYTRELLSYILSEEKYFKSVLCEHSDQHFLRLWENIILKDVMKEYHLDPKKISGEKAIALEMMISGVIGAYTYWLFHLGDVSIETVLSLILKIWDFYRF